MRKLSEYECAVATATPKTPIWEVADEMDAQGVGSVVVVDDADRPVGIVTDRDLTIRVIAAGLDDAKTTAADVMTPDPVVVDWQQTLGDATALMQQHVVRRLPVVREGKVIGVIALDDIVAGLNSSLWNVTDAVRIETREARRSAPRRRRREERDNALEELRSQIATLGKDTADALRNEVNEILRRLGGGRRG